MYGHTLVPMVLKTRLRRGKLCFALELSYLFYVWVLGVCSGCWKWGGVGGESKLGAGSEGVTCPEMGHLRVE